MFEYSTTIRLHHTDATGRIFFPQLLTMATECFEAFLMHQPALVPFERVGYAMPVVHAEVDISLPLQRSMKIVLQLQVEKIGNSSVTLRYRVKTASGDVAATMHVVHVVVDTQTQQSRTIPEALRHVLQSALG